MVKIVKICLTAEQLPSVKKTLMLRRNEKLMKNNSIPHNNGPCESIGCDSNLTEKIPIKVGDKGTIFLFLCKNCKSKFSTNDDLVDEVIAQIFEESQRILRLLNKLWRMNVKSDYQISTSDLQIYK